jgi:AcrR family transcriptional regulator
MDINSHALGRPRSHDVDEAIIRAALELLARKGPDGLTINAVARRSGVARASIYLRYPGREALLAATVAAAIGRPPFRQTGDLESDLHRAGAQAQAVLANPAFRSVLPEVVRGLLQQPDSPDGIDYDMVAPNRGPLAEEYRQLAASAGLRTDVDPQLVVKMIVGSVLMMLLADGVPATPEMADQAVEIIIAGLKVPGAEPA